MKDIPVLTLGEATLPSPLRLNSLRSDVLPSFTLNGTRILNSTEINNGSVEEEIAFEKAGPRDRIFFPPSSTRVAIVTCGGLCPGLNNVIRSLVLELYHNYGVKNIQGICYGYQGMGEKALKPMMRLDPDLVTASHPRQP